MTRWSPEQGESRPSRAVGRAGCRVPGEGLREGPRVGAARAGPLQPQPFLPLAGGPGRLMGEGVGGAWAVSFGGERASQGGDSGSRGEEKPLRKEGSRDLRGRVFQGPLM